MAFASLRDLVAAGGVAVLTGAGISTGSGIPDYRGPNGSLRRHTPMTYQQFTGDAESRRRYWARSHVGWRHVALARPNPGHHAVAALEGAGLVDGVITQNVDGLHSAAGSRRVIDLHGSLARVRCRGCGVLSDRADLDRRLRLRNPGFGNHGFDSRAVAGSPLGAEVNPDGDATLAEAEIDGFAVVGCADCDGDLEPDVVFFGATVPPARLAAAVDLLTQSRALLVLGSSLAVMSGYRFVLRAGELGIPVGIVNQGPTRGDARAAFTLDAQLSTVLPRLATELAGAAAR